MRRLHDGFCALGFLLTFGCACVFQYGKGELKFSSLTFDDSGMYQCIAENYWGIKYANAELRVIGESLVVYSFQLTVNLFLYNINSVFIISVQPVRLHSNLTL